MKKILFAGLVAIGTASVPAHATTLNFDSLSSSCGNAGFCGLTGDSNQVIYTEAGYTLTFNSFGGFAHINDGTGVSGTYNWHDGGANITGSTLVLTKSGGGLFDLLSFDFVSNNNMTVAAPSFTSLLLNGTGIATPNFLNVASVTFSGSGTYQLDNLQVSAGGAQGAVPEPATWAMMLLGFAVVGGAMRSRQKQNVSVRYA